MAEVTSSSSNGVEVQGDGASREALRAIITDIPIGKRKQYQFWLREYRTDWRGEVPTRIHERAIGGGLGLAFAPEFIAYIGHIDCGNDDCKECADEKRQQRTRQHFRRDNPRQRTTKAFRKLRSVAPREFDAMFMYCMHDHAPTSIANSMNEEMRRKGRPERYSPESIVLLLFSGVDKVMGWW
jgi:hypothetical protein